MSSTKENVEKVLDHCNVSGYELGNSKVIQNIQNSRVFEIDAVFL